MSVKIDWRKLMKGRSGPTQRGMGTLLEETPWHLKGFISHRDDCGALQGMADQTHMLRRVESEESE